MRIDAHQHFWIFDPVRDAWITNEMKVIRGNFLPEDLEPHLRKAGMDGCIAVQADQSEKETRFLLDLATQHPILKGVVGWIDLQQEDIDVKLNAYSSFPALKGFRHILQGEQQRDLMLQPRFRHGLNLIGQKGYTYDILIYADQLRFIPEMVANHPHQKFVIDHLAKPLIKDGLIDDWKRDIEKLSSFENVYCKLSGLVTEADWQSWKPDHFIPYLDTVVQAFGTERIMFGSDWPVCLLAASYEQVLAVAEGYFSAFSAAEKAAVFGGNAIKFYNL